MKFQRKEKEETCEKLGPNVISLKDKLKKSNTWLKFEKSIETLNEILSCQRSPFIKTSLGYYENQNTPEEKPKSMLIFSKAPPLIKAIVGKEMMTSRFLILLTRTTRMSPKELFHQEGLSPTGTKISFLATLFLAIILVIKQ